MKNRKRHELAQPKTETRIVFNEAGTTGLKAYGNFVQEAYLAQYQYPQVAPLYAKLIRSDPETLMVGMAFSAWARNSNIIVDLPDKPSDVEKEYHEFIYTVFDDVEGGVSGLMEGIVRKTPFYGFYVWNTPLARRDPNWVPPAFKDSNGERWPDSWRSQYNDGRIGIRRFSPRDPSSFAGWKFDGVKRPYAMIQQDYPNEIVELKLDECLHLRFGDPNNPEGMSPLEAIARLADLKRGYETVMGIGSEHVAGYLNVQKTTAGALSSSDKQNVADAAKSILAAQESNYALWPYGMNGEVKDINFSAANAILETIKYYSVTKLAIFMMQFVAFNIFTRTGALASATDSSQIAVFTFNAMMDGFAAQFDAQIGRRLFELNKDSFPGLERRPKIRFKHVEKNVALGEMGDFFSKLNGILPLGDEDYRAIRARSGFMPLNLPEVVANSSDIPSGVNPVGDPQGNPANEVKPVKNDQVAQQMARLEALAEEYDLELYEALKG